MNVSTFLNDSKFFQLDQYWFFFFFYSLPLTINICVGFGEVYLLLYLLYTIGTVRLLLLFFASKISPPA